ncbi:LacI family DNA-binding transcriptional regulator [Amaricoccus sp.]|uniref:LacI family DNA-binding transcriptional regulator n=1 Tax=Amaricoccus sp. TaxID=1872485 RepID=UPI001B4BE613|nr:LacI family DNA-binding transcriptional regulator [Amaricoccus sp.]MBP7242015.1 LacI family DNA-binding transcriptional regulator [Amaricoccus sp.]
MATIYDVAKAAGVSPKTVSRVMNGDAPVNARTRELVDAAMDQLGYVPSSAARTMRSSRTGLVGLVTGAISGPQAAGGATGLPDLQIVQGIQRVLADHGMTLLISDTGGRFDQVPRLLRTLHEHRVEGIFYVAPHHQRIALPQASGSRLVLVNGFDDAGTPCVLPDDADGQRQLVAALVAAGHRRIGFLTLPQGFVAHEQRLDGYRRALEAAGIPYDPGLVIQGDYDGQAIERERLSEAIDLLFALDPPPTALCCGNDRLAVAVYGILRARGVPVPEQMSVAGYDDYRVISETLFPQLTTMELPYHRMGAAAARLMLGQLRGQEPLVAGHRVEVQGELRWRASVVPGPGQRH